MALSDATPAGIDQLTRVTLAATDVMEAMTLSQEAGWNQTAVDWSLFIAHGRVLAYRSADGRLVATGAALPYADGHGWISMVLVTSEWRHRGLATALLNDAIHHLDEAGLTPVLDATPDGAQVYRRMGFVPGFDFERWEADAGWERKEANSSNGQTVRQVAHHDASDIDAISAIDAEAHGVGRAFLLHDFLARPGTRAWRTTDGDGFVISRDGSRARQIGPLVAADEAQAITLLEAAFDGPQARTFIDVPTRSVALSQWLQRCGFKRQRPFTRMARRPSSVLDGSARSFAVAGPEFG